MQQQLMASNSITQPGGYLVQLVGLHWGAYEYNEPEAQQVVWDGIWDLYGKGQVLLLLLPCSAPCIMLLHSLTPAHISSSLWCTPRSMLSETWLLPWETLLLARPMARL